MNEHDHLAAQRARLAGAIGTTAAQMLDNPVRLHDSDGIGSLPNSGVALPKLSEAANLALELVDDLCSPDAYGHAVPVEVVKRAGRIRAMLRPRTCGVGYSGPPPVRCEFCDSE
jgi:hypothetical protein